MGRYVRPLLRSLAMRADIELTLLVRDAHDAPTYRAIVGDAAAVTALNAANVRGRYDCIWYPWNGIRFAARAPALVTINDDFAFAYPARGLVARLREQRPIKRAVRVARSIVTISTWARETLRERFGLPRDRIHTIPLGPDPYFVPSPEPSAYGEPFVLAVGIGDSRKNVALLVEAFERAFPPRTARLVLVGAPTPALAGRLRDSTATITVVPRADDAALRHLYRTADVVAVPSLAEGFGLVAVEAQACGAAVIAANASALPEAVGDAGLLVDPHDRDAWSTALQTMIGDPALRERYRTRAAARWRDFTPDATLDAVLRALARVRDDRLEALDEA